MAVYKCKMCGGTLDIKEGMTVCECEFCGTKQTIPTVKDEGLQTLFNRANTLRMKAEFDKAADVYEKILQHSDSEAEAYWGLILCKYGIEYVEDPATFKRVPTCHRASYDAVATDEDYRNALRYADSVQRGIYEEEAVAIDEIQKGIIALAQKEDPYDVFICYKETDENGNRTQDSVIANDIYYQLTHEGYKVFYAAITLEDKLGREYEPYIFSALNTSKVMLALGTKPEYFNAVWVKNEWSRFLKIMKKDRSRLLIPCYRDMDPYELPEEFAHLQAQDMSKIGFINDLVRGIKKVIDKNRQPAQKESQSQEAQYSGNVTALLKRGNMALEDHEWDKADSFFEEVLNQDAECAEAYLGKLMVKEHKANFRELSDEYKNKYLSSKPVSAEAFKPDEQHIQEMCEKYAIDGFLESATIKGRYKYDLQYEALTPCRQSQCEKQLNELNSERLLTRARKYSKGETKQRIEQMFQEIKEILEARIEKAKEEDDKKISDKKQRYGEFLKEADAIVIKLNEEAAEKRDSEYNKAVDSMEKATNEGQYQSAITMFTSLCGYKDSLKRIDECRNEIGRLKEEYKKEQERKEEEKRIQQRKKSRNRKVGISIIIGLSLIAVAYVFWLKPIVDSKLKVFSLQKKASDYMENENYADAVKTYEELATLEPTEKNVEKVEEAKYHLGLQLYQNEKYSGASSVLEEINAYSDMEAVNFLNGDAKYHIGKRLCENEEYIEACKILSEISICSDMDALDDLQKKAATGAAYKYFDNGEYDLAYEILETLGDNEGLTNLKKQQSALEAKFDKSLRDICINGKIGDIVTMGNYEQDGNTGNGEEPIEWKVLDKKDDHLLLLCKQGIEVMKYGTTVNWIDSKVYRWLNDDFYQNAFSTFEKNYILSTLIKTGKGNTDNYLFIPIEEDVTENYPNFDWSMSPSDYVIKNKNASTSWLRTASGMTNMKTLGLSGTDIFFVPCSSERIVRPMMWIKCNLAE